MPAKNREKKARAGRPASRPVAGIKPALGRIDVAIEACWLAAAVLVPLIVLPETSFLSFTSVPKIAVLRTLAGATLMLMAIRSALAPRSKAANMPGASGAPGPQDKSALASAWTWLSATPTRAAVAAMLGVLAVTALSAIASLSPYLSVWGRDPGGDGYDLYTTACYVVLGLAVVVLLRRPVQVWRLLAAVTATGAAAGLIAALQNYGFSPFDISGTAGVRVTGTAGNPIFLGALLVLTLPASLATLAYVGNGSGFRRTAWWVLAVPIAGVQVAALAFTLSRGPWLGAAFAIPTLLGLMWFYGTRKAATALAVVIASSIILTFVALSFPTWIRQAPTSVAQGVERRLNEAVSPGSVVARAATADEEVSQGLSGRIDRWSTSARLSWTRPPVPEGADPGRFVRIFTGYGPDMFRFVFPLRAPAALAAVRTDAAHNDHLNRLVELGILGSIAYVILGIAVVAAIVNLIRGARRSGKNEAAFVGIGLAAAFIGRVVEQGLGIAKPGDLTVEWLLLGLAVAAPAVFGLLERPVQPVAPLPTQSRGSGSSRRGGAAAPWIPVVVAAAIGVAAIGALTWVKGINYLRADRAARQTTVIFNSDPGEGLRQLEAAITLAPDVRDYYHRQSLMLQAVGDADPARLQAFLREAVAADLHAVELNPMSIDSNLAAAYSAWRVAQTGDVQMALQTLAIYERLAQLTPQNPLVQVRLEALRTAVKVTPAAP
ncbi:MAG: O-antigen ligase family protein [Chloroflexi bacterium]|nr:O-antigen ligase family protein [Chloroflexota bacterium]